MLFLLYDFFYHSRLIQGFVNVWFVLCTFLNYYVHNVCKNTVMDNIRIFTRRLAIMNSCLVYWKAISFVFMLDTYIQRPIPVTARSKVRFCGRSVTGIAVSNPAGGTEFSLWWVECVGSYPCIGLITRPEESYRECGASEYDRECSIMGKLWSTRGCRASGEKHYLQSRRDHFDSFCIGLCKKEINVIAVFLLVHPQVSRQSWSKLVFITCCSCCRRSVIEALAIQCNEQTFTQMSENIAVKEVVWWLNYQRNLLFLNINTSRIL